MKIFNTSKLVKSEDLNHHGTLFAGRLAEWFIEGAFITAAGIFGDPSGLVCKKLHGLAFNAPVKKGAIINLETKLVLVGTTSIKVYGKVTKVNGTESLVDGFVTFVCVDENGKKKAHGLLQPEAQNEEDKRLIEIAKKLR
ncbi:MAG: acyl-CoA thioesterase [Firmicutes bacterium]|nr:acyl-CoA thioesterase [Bacillota bacterium]